MDLRGIARFFSDTLNNAKSRQSACHIGTLLALLARRIVAIPRALEICGANSRASNAKIETASTWHSGIPASSRRTAWEKGTF